VEIKMSESKTNKFSSVFKENKDLIRLAIECFVLLGVFYYFNKKILKLSKHIEEISQKLELQDDLIEKQNLTITELHLNTQNVPTMSEAFYPFKDNTPAIAKKKVEFELFSDKPSTTAKVTKKASPQVTPAKVAPSPKATVQAPVAKSKEVQTPMQPTQTPRPRPTAQVEIPDILRFLNMPTRIPEQSTQEIEILSGDDDEDIVEEVVEIVEQNEEEDLDKELESEMKDLD